MDTSKLNITIVGLGLIGGSFAKAIRKYVPVKNLWAIDIDESVLEKATKLGIIDKGFKDTTIPLNQSDLVILCLYPSLTIKFMKENMSKFKSNAIITDTAGIKEKIIEEVKESLREDLEFIGGHPMAGRECEGFEFSNAEVFNNAQYILVKNENNKLENINLLKDIIGKVKFKDIIEMLPGQHDEMVAFTSQLPHIIACVLMNNNLISENFQCIGGSFKDATRVAKINCGLWEELFMENKSHIVQQLRSFVDDMNKITNLIENDEREDLRKLLNHGSNLRKEMDI